MVRVDDEGAEKRGRREGEASGGHKEEEDEGRKKRNKSKKQGGRRRQQSLVSRLIPLPLSHLIALSHATSGCVGVSGRLKKHVCAQKRTVEAR